MLPKTTQRSIPLVELTAMNDDTTTPAEAGNDDTARQDAANKAADEAPKPPTRGRRRANKAAEQQPAEAAPAPDEQKPEVLFDDADAAIKSCFEELETLRAEAAEINARRRELREGLKARGLQPDAIRAGMAIARIEDEATRKAFDATYAKVRGALGVPLGQLPLWEPAAEPDADTTKH